MDGNGTLFWSNGNKYIGHLVSNKYHGYGKLYYNNSDVYNGSFVHGKNQVLVPIQHQRPLILVSFLMIVCMEMVSTSSITRSIMKEASTIISGMGTA